MKLFFCFLVLQGLIGATSKNLTKEEVREEFMAQLTAKEEYEAVKCSREVCEDEFDDYNDEDIYVDAYYGEDGGCKALKKEFQQYVSCVVRECPDVKEVDALCGDDSRTFEFGECEFDFTCTRHPVPAIIGVTVGMVGLLGVAGLIFFTQRKRAETGIITAKPSDQA